MLKLTKYNYNDHRGQPIALFINPAFIVMMTAAGYSDATNITLASGEETTVHETPDAILTMMTMLREAGHVEALR